MNHAFFIQPGLKKIWWLQLKIMLKSTLGWVLPVSLRQGWNMPGRVSPWHEAIYINNVFL